MRVEATPASKQRTFDMPSLPMDETLKILGSAVSVVGIFFKIFDTLRKWLQERSREDRQRKLRERIVSLLTFLKASEEGMSSRGHSAQAFESNASAREELEALYLQLSKICEPPSRPDAQPVPTGLRKWLLLFAPTHVSAWVPRTIFYLSILFWFLGLYTELDSEELQPGYFLLLGFIPLLGVWAAVTDLPSFPPPGVGRLRRWLLLYIPFRKRALWAHVVFWFFTFFLLPALIVDIGTDSGDYSFSLLRFAEDLSRTLGMLPFVVLGAIAAHGWAMSYPRHFSPQDQAVSFPA
jgi:hypothetical protein